MVLKKELSTLWNKLTSDITEIPEILKPSYFPGLDGLRAVSIIIVLVGHAFTGRWLVRHFPGAIGVDIFFVISGFLITTLLLKEKVKKGEASLPRFYIRRILRIFPVVYLYLLCLLILNNVFDLGTTLRMILTAGLFVGNFPALYGTSNNWQTAHFWSLAVEEQFYLLFPFIIVKWPNKYLVLTIVLLVSLPFIVIIGRLPSNIYNSPIIYKVVLSFTYLLGYGTSSILIGSLTSFLIFKKIIIIKNGGSYFLSFVIFVIAIGLRINGLLNWNVIIYIFPILISYIILLNLSNNNFLSKILNHPIFVKIGVLSYSLYIWQQLFTYDQPWKNLFKYSNSPILNIPICFVVAYISYFFYERRFLILKEKFKNS